MFSDKKDHIKIGIMRKILLRSLRFRASSIHIFISYQYSTMIKPHTPGQSYFASAISGENSDRTYPYKETETENRKKK